MCIRDRQVIEGAYSLLVMSPRKLIAVRDPHGFRPLCVGKYNDSYVFASESAALDACGAEFVRDVEPGEIVIVDPVSYTHLCREVLTSTAVSSV